MALANALPDGTELDVASASAEDASGNVSVGSNEHEYDDGEMLTQSEERELLDEVRVRRKINEMESIGPTVMNEMNKGDPAKVPLQGIIAAIETDLVTTALLANTQLHKRQSMEFENNAKAVAKNDSIDANENLFEDLFNFTRPEPQNDGTDNVVKIPLNGLVNAIESTLINSAQNLKDTERLQSHSGAQQENHSNAKPIGLHRIDRDTDDEVVQVQTLSGNKPLQSLNILSSIALKPVRNDTNANGDDDDDEDEIIPSTEYPEEQRANLTVIHASNKVSLVSDGNDKLAHVQHQTISKAVFRSDLAIFPSFTPKTLVQPLAMTTSAQQTSMEETNSAPAMDEHNRSPSDATNKSETNLSQKTAKLREKIAEIQAPPVILSNFP